MTEIFTGVVKHECGWVSDGGAFPEGAGCPQCGERIALLESSRRAPKLDQRSFVGEKREAERVGDSDSDPPINLTNPGDLAALTVPEVAGFVSELPFGPELAEIELLEQAGENRKGVLAAIRARIAELLERSKN